MSYHRWAWLISDESAEDPVVGIADLLPNDSTSSVSETGYPALFSVTDGVGIFSIGPGQGLLYYFNQKTETAFLFPDSAD